MRPRKVLFRWSAALVGGLVVGATLSGVGVSAETSVAYRPLSEYVGFGVTTEQQLVDEKTFELEESARQQITAECMERSGFVYVGHAHSVLITDATPLESVFDESIDPNESYVASLTDSRRLDYFVSLTGYENPDSREAGIAEGCVGEAHRDIPGVFAVRSRVVEELLDLENAIRNDPAVLDAKGQWALCMTRDGYSVPDDLRARPRAIVDSGEDMADTQLAEYIRQSDDCASVVGLVEIEYEVRLVRELEFIDKHEDVLVRR